MVEKVVLVSTYSAKKYNRLSLGPASSNLAIITIKEALETAGFTNISLFPSNPIPPKNGYFNEDLIGEGLKQTVGTASDVVFGISTPTDNYATFEYISLLIQELFPFALIVGGGNHFVWENNGKQKLVSNGIPIRDPVEIALQERYAHDRYAHALVEGHAEPFIDLVVNHNGNIESVKRPGFYRLHNSQVEGIKGKGKYPETTNLPYVEEGRLFHTLFSNRCRNGCDFCSINSAIEIDVDKSARTLIDVIGDEPADLCLDDTNPFEPEDLEKYANIFEALDSRNGSIFKDCFIDPSLLAEKSYATDLVEFLWKHKFVSYFLGRECVTEEDAKIIGTKHRGEVRKQHQLDEEKSGIITLITELKKRAFPKRGGYYVRISYIAHPYQTKESALAMIKEIEEFCKMSCDPVFIIPSVGPLTPYPGTEIKKRFLEDISCPENFLFHTDFANPWSYDIGPAVYFLDEILDGNYMLGTNIMGIRFGFPEYFKFLHESVEAAFSGRLGIRRNQDKKRYY